MKIHEYNEMMAYLTRPGRVKLVKGSPDPMMLLEEKLKAAYREKLLKNFNEGKKTESFREFVQTQKEIDINPGKKKLDKAIEEAKKILKDKKTKFKANMVPGLETLIKTVEAMPNDFKAKRYWTLGLKGLGILATPIIAYDGYTAIRDGLPPDEIVARALLGADKILYKGKEYLTMSPEARAAKGRKTRQTMAEAAKEDSRVKGYAEMYGVEGKFKPNFIQEGDEELIEAAEKKYADHRKKKDAARASERIGIAKSIKDRIYGVPLEEITDQVYNQGGRVGFDEGSKPKSPGRRTFLKGITALAALPVVGKFFKLGKVLERASTYTGPAIQKIKGMPEWFPSLVKKLWNEGEDVTKQAAYGERQVVKRGTLEVVMMWI